MVTPKQKTYSLLLLITFLASIILYNFFFLEKIHKLNVSDIIKSGKDNKSSENFYYDIDNDGVKEYLSLGKDRGNNSIMYLAILREQNNYIGQYNFNCSNMGLDWIDFIDLNNDNAKEIVAFYEKRDSIFCSIIDWENDKLLSFNTFVLAKPDTIYSDKWAPTLKIIGNVKNKKNETEIIFSITTGFSQIPRGVFAFNIKSKTVTKQFTIGGAIGTVDLFDLNRNGNKEIIIGTNASANNEHLPKLPPFNDLSSWLIVLDNNFDTLFTKCFNKPFSTVRNSYLKGKKNNFLITAFSYQNKLNILKFNAVGDTVKERHFTANSTFIPSFYYKETDKIFIPTNKILNILDSDLLLIKKIKFKSPIIYIHPINLDLDNKNEYILWQRDYLSILDDDFSKITQINEKLHFISTMFSLSDKKDHHGYKIHINSNGQYLKFSLIPNPIYTFRYLIFLGIFFAVLLVGLILHMILRRIFIFINLLEYSTQKSRLGIIIANSNGKYLSVNKSAKEILGIDKNGIEQVINKHTLLKNFIDNAFLLERKNNSEIYLSNGKIISISIIPIKSPLNLLLAFYIQFDDLTESLLNDRAKTLAHSIQKVAHEIKTPLSSVLLSLDTLEQNLNIPTENEELVTARNEVDRIKTFINNYLKFANTSGIEITECNLLEIVENALSKFTNYLSHGIKINIDIENTIEVLVDPYQLEEVFQVLIENSIDALKGKGKIKINAISGNKQNIMIIVSDNGSGIKEEHLATIFQPYMTTRKDGTGMGLAIAKKILEDHGSKIKVKSSKENGTEFSFTLPV